MNITSLSDPLAVYIDGSRPMTGGLIIDVDSTEALLVRKDGDAGDVFVVDTVNSRVGIGTSTPDQALQVLGFIHIGQNTADGVELFIQGLDPVLRFDGVGGSQTSIIYDSGKTFSFGDGTVNIMSVANSGSGSDVVFSTRDEVGADFIFRPKGNEALRIKDSGNVGINTTGPDRKLDILDASNPQLRLTHTDGTVWTDFQTNASGNTIFTNSGSLFDFTGALTVSENLTSKTLTLTTTTQNYKFIAEDTPGADLWLQSQTSGVSSILRMASKDADGVGSVEMQYFAVGGPAGITNRERLRVGWDSSNNLFSVQTEAQGDGTLQALSLFTEGNANQILLNTDGSIDIASLNISGFTISGGLLTLDGTTVLGLKSTSGVVQILSDWNVAENKVCSNLRTVTTAIFGGATDKTTFDSSGNITQAGTATAILGSGTTIGTLTLADGLITDSGGSISFGDEDITTSGRLGVGGAIAAGIGINGSFINTTTSGATAIIGSLGVSTSDGTITGDQVGFQGVVNKTSTNSITGAICTILGKYSDSTTGTPTMSDISGMKSDIDIVSTTAKTYSAIAGFRSVIALTTTVGTFDDIRGLDVPAVIHNIGGGTVTDVFGIHLGQQTIGNNNWQLYSVGGASFIGGNGSGHGIYFGQTDGAERMVSDADGTLDVYAGTSFEIHQDANVSGDISVSGVGTFEGLRVDNSATPKLVLLSSPAGVTDPEVHFIEANAFGTKLGDASTWGFKWQYESSSNELRLFSGNQTTVLERLSVGRDSGDFDFRAGDLLTTGILTASGIVLPKTSGSGIKVDTATPTFGFNDIIGDQFAKNTGASRPTLTAYNGAVDAWQFGNGEEAFLTYHIQHDYVIGTDIHLHIHWSQTSATNTGGHISFRYSFIYAKGHNQASFTSAVITDTFNSITLADAGTNQYRHHLTEITISAATATAALMDRDDLEPDGVIELTLEMVTNNLTDSGSVLDPFIHNADIHFQTTGISGTKSRIPDFYT